jgi:ABC-type glutathione transport system ATPase component
MTALMGPSGSGKTTLLDIMAGRKTQGTTQGDMLFAGQKPSSQFLRRYTGEPRRPPAADCRCCRRARQHNESLNLHHHVHHHLARPRPPRPSLRRRAGAGTAAARAERRPAG